MVLWKRGWKEEDEKAREAKVSDERYLEEFPEEKQNAEKDFERSGVSAAIVRYVMCGEVLWMDLETAAEVNACDGSESPNSWAS